MVQRGLITNPDRARQLKDFQGLRFGTITPTDIDGVTLIALPTLSIAGLIEYQHKGYVIIEVKLRGTPLLDGQMLALERLHDDLWAAERPTLCVIGEHTVYDCSQSIDVAIATVARYRRNSEWMPGNGLTVRDSIKEFLTWLTPTFPNPCRQQGTSFPLPPLINKEELVPKEPLPVTPRGREIADRLRHGEWVCDNPYCRGFHYWTRPDGGKVCVVCHPPPRKAS